MIELTTIGSACVEIEVTEAALPEAEGGVTLWVRHWTGTPLEEQVAYTLTADEAKELVADVGRVLSPWLFEDDAASAPYPQDARGGAPTPTSGQPLNECREESQAYAQDLRPRPAHCGDRWSPTQPA